MIHGAGISGRQCWETDIQSEENHNPQISPCRIEFRGTPYQSVPIRKISSRETAAPTLWTGFKYGFVRENTEHFYLLSGLGFYRSGQLHGK